MGVAPLADPATESCCTCATLLAFQPSASDNKHARLGDRRLECCHRIICGGCLENNDRFSTYCPYCQISTHPTTLPQGLKDPPSYDLHTAKSFRTAAPVTGDAPPAYTPHVAPTQNPQDEKAALAAQEADADAPDILHYLNHQHDTVTSLSLRYGVPANALRQANNINSDHLLLGRRTVLIPGEYYKGGISLSPRPIEGEEEELRKSKIRRFMTSCKVSDYDVALLYLEQVNYDLDSAVDTFLADEAWERSQGKGPESSKARKSRGSFWRGL